MSLLLSSQHTIRLQAQSMMMLKPNKLTILLPPTHFFSSHVPVASHTFFSSLCYLFFTETKISRFVKWVHRCFREKRENAHANEKIVTLLFHWCVFFISILCRARNLMWHVSCCFIAFFNLISLTKHLGPFCFSCYDGVVFI